MPYSSARVTASSVTIHLVVDSHWMAIIMRCHFLERIDMIGKLSFLDIQL